MGRSQRHLREFQGVDSGFTTAHERQEPSKRPVADQYAGAAPAGRARRPACTALPTIGGSSSVASGTALTCTTGTWLSGSGLTYTRRWLRNRAPIDGATGATYTTASADVGKLITCEVTATNAGGSTSVVTAQSRLVT